MKSILTYISALVITSWLLQFIGIWWLLTIPALILSWIFNLNTTWSYFIWAFVGVFLLWTLQALFIDWNNNHILSERMGTLLGNIGGYGIIVVTGAYGGLIAGLTAMLSAQIRRNYFITHASKNSMEEYIDLQDIKKMDADDQGKDFI